nr:ORF100 [Acipenserid herpesvirus 1]
MTTLLKHTKAFADADYVALQKFYPNKGPFVRVYFTKTQADKNGKEIDRYLAAIPKYLNCHVTIYVRYLAKFGAARQLTKHNTTYYFTQLNAPYLCGVIFLSHLYMHDQGLVTNASLLNCEPLSQLLDLARFYDIEWLQQMYHNTLAFKPVNSGPVFQLGSELVVVGSDHLTSVGSPRYMKAFTTTPDGQTWFGLCSNDPHRIELWIKRYQENIWTLLTSVVDRSLIKHKFQLTLADNCCLYVLANGVYLECYNLSTYQWQKIKHAGMKNYLTYTMVETGDGSIPLTLVANTQAQQVLTVTYEPYSMKVYKDQTLIPQALDEKVKPKPSDPLLAVQEYYESIQTQCPVTNLNSRKRLGVVMGDQERPIKWRKISSLAEGFSALKDTRRAVTQHYFYPSDQDTKLAEAFKELEIQRKTACTLTQQWVKVLCCKRVLYGMKRNGNWYTNIVKPEEGLEEGCWNRYTQVLRGNILAWDAKTQTVVRVEREGTKVGVNDDHVDVDWFNPNFLDHSFLHVINDQHQSVYRPPRYLHEAAYGTPGGLDCLINVQVNKKTNGKLDFSPAIEKQPLPYALNVFLKNLTPEIADQILEDRKVKYENGGVSIVDKVHPETGAKQIMLFTLDPPAVHMIHKQNLDAFVSRYACHNKKPVLLSMGATKHPYSRSITFYNYTTPLAVHCVYCPNSVKASPLPQLSV